MNRAQFRAFVTENAEWFQGPLESEEALRDAEGLLGVRFSEQLKWLLTEWGYGLAAGMENLDDSIRWTLAVRKIWRMPTRYVLLEDGDEAGYVLMDTATVNAEGEPKVLWVSFPPNDEEAHVLRSYATFAEWSLFRLEEEKDSMEGDS